MTPNGYGKSYNLERLSAIENIGYTLEILPPVIYYQPSIANNWQYFKNKNVVLRLFKRGRNNIHP